MATWATDVNTSLLTTYLVRKFIPALEQDLQTQRFTTKALIPEGMGNIARFNVFSNPDTTDSTTALTEGTTTEHETTVTTTGTDATIAEYGEFIPESKLQKYTQVKGAREELSARMAFGAALAVDTLVRNEILTTTTAWYALSTVAGGDQSTVTVEQMSAAAVIGAAEVLKGAFVRGFSGVSGHPNRHYALILGTMSERDMVQEASTGRMTWGQAVTNVPGVMGQEKWVNGYMGSVYGTACYCSQNVSQTATGGVTADNNMLLGEGAIGAVGLEDMDPNVYVNVASSQDVGNPYRNRNTIAWHINFATALIDVNRAVRLYADGV
jgi:N4-gp56 family major capsid protein